MENAALKTNKLGLKCVECGGPRADGSVARCRMCYTAKSTRLNLCAAVASEEYSGDNHLQDDRLYQLLDLIIDAEENRDMARHALEVQEARLAALKDAYRLLTT